MKDEQFDALMKKLEEIRCGIIDNETEVQEIKKMIYQGIAPIKEKDENGKDNDKD